MKKILISTALAALLCTTLTACNGGDDDCEGLGTATSGVALMSVVDGKSGGSSGGKSKGSGKSATSGGSSGSKSGGKTSKSKSHDDDDCDDDE